jgi:predicted heme/steroid binding protein
MLISCDYQHDGLSDQQKQLDGRLRNLTQKFLVENISKVGFGGKAFCAYRTLDLNQENSNISEYVLAVCQEYFLQDGVVKKGTGHNAPVAIYIKYQNGIYNVADYKVPRDGTMYSYDVEHNFPQKTHEQIFRAGTDPALSDEVEKEAKAYFDSSKVQ